MPSTEPLVDTNVISELVRRSPNPGVLEWAGAVERISLSVVTLEEIAFGLAWHPNSRVADWFDRFFEDRCTIIPVDATVARRAGQVRGRLRSEGVTVTQADALIGATAERHGLTLVTRNTRDFEPWRVALFNPFR